MDYHTDSPGNLQFHYAQAENKNPQRNTTPIIGRNASKIRHSQEAYKGGTYNFDLTSEAEWTPPKNQD
jgi:hypothetical protein